MVLAKLGCEVCATDLASNLPLLAHNFERNGKPALTWLLRCPLHHPCKSNRLSLTALLRLQLRGAAAVASRADG